MYFEMEVEIGQSYGVTQWPSLPDGVSAFHSGDLITVEVPEPVEFIVDNTSEHPPVDFATHFMPVFSDRLVAAFRAAGVDNFQTYKARLKNPNTGETWDKYQVVNVLGKIACADLENSVYTVLLEPSCMFSELVINVEKANGALFFRLLESHEKIIVHNAVLDYMYTEDDDPIFDGVDFTPIKSSHNIKK
jgi:hypothetical protein